jgi:hypothetical protein
LWKTPDSIDKLVGHNIRIQRLAKGLSQTQPKSATGACGARWSSWSRKSRKRRHKRAPICPAMKARFGHSLKERPPGRVRVMT